MQSSCIGRQISLSKNLVKETTTDTDSLIQELREELTELSYKVQELESTKVSKEILYQELEHNHSIINDLRSQYEKQNVEYKENISIASKMVQKIQEPISQVSQNLQNLKEQTQEKQIQESLNSCLDTLEKLMNQCNESSAYFSSLLDDKQYPLQDCFALDIFKNCFNHPLYPLCEFQIEEKIKQKIILRLTLLQNISQKFFSFLQKTAQPQSAICISIKEITPESSLNNLLNLNIKIHFCTKKDFFWLNNWQDSLSIGEDNEDKLPLEWCLWKKELMSNKGDFFIEEKNQKINGISIMVPFTYSNT